MKTLLIGSMLVCSLSAASGAQNLDCSFPDAKGRPQIEEYARTGDTLSEHMVDLGAPVGWFGVDYRVVRDDATGLAAIWNSTSTDPTGYKVLGFGAEVFLYDKATGNAQITHIDAGSANTSTKSGTCKAHN